MWDHFLVTKFGNSAKLRSKGKYKLLVILAGKVGILELDLIKSDIPLLMSKKAMKEARMKIGLTNDTVEVFGFKASLLTTRSGHYCIPLLGDSGEEIEMDWILSVNLTALTEKEQYKSMVNLQTIWASSDTEIHQIHEGC